MKSYSLDIYPWHACRGHYCGLFHIEFDQPEQALNHISNEYDKPFAYAVLSKRTQDGWGPVDWNGDGLNYRQEWPKVKGENFDKIHPDLQALLDEYEFLLSEIIRIRRNECPDQGTISIANDLLVNRHPNIMGWANKMGWEAAGELCEQS